MRVREAFDALKLQSVYRVSANIAVFDAKTVIPDSLSNTSPSLIAKLHN